MHTVELREQALALAEQLGYRIREEWLGGSGGGQCEFAGCRWIFVDLALNAEEQLEQVAEGFTGHCCSNRRRIRSPDTRRND